VLRGGPLFGGKGDHGSGAASYDDAEQGEQCDEVDHPAKYR
jgi:hypothetical protein